MIVPSGSADSFCEVPGPDQGGYRCANATETFDWLDTENGTALSLGDDEFATEPLPFSFDWYGNIYTDVNISSNGFICFENCTDASDTWDPENVPVNDKPNNLLACGWADLDPGARGEVRVNTTASNDKLVVEYRDIPHNLDFSTHYDFQIWIEEDGTARCMLDHIPDDGFEKTSGTENVTGLDGVRYKNGPWSADDLSILYAFTPSPPQNVTVDAGDQQAHIDWDPPERGTVQFYNVTCKYLDAGEDNETDDCGETEFKHIANVSDGTTYDHTGLGDDVEVCYEVSAVNAVGQGLPSEDDCDATIDEPGSPQNFTADKVPDELKVTLSWNEPIYQGNSDILRYRVLKGDTELKNDSVDGFNTKDGNFTLTDASVACGDEPTYEVYAKTEKDWGPAASVTVTIDHVCPDAPGNLDDTTGPDWANITWEAPSDAEKVDEYVVRHKRSDQGDDAFNDNETRTNETYANITGLEEGTTYDVRVRSSNDTGGESSPAEIETATLGTPGMPEAVNETPSVDSITVTWREPNATGGAEVDHYLVHRFDKAAGEHTVTLEKDASDELGTIDGDRYYQIEDSEDGLQTGNRYNYSVQAVNLVGAGPNGTSQLGSEVGVTPVMTDGAPEPEIGPTPPKLNLTNVDDETGIATLTINSSAAVHEQQFEVQKKPQGGGWETTNHVYTHNRWIDDRETKEKLIVRVPIECDKSPYKFRARGQWGFNDTSSDWSGWSNIETGGTEHHAPKVPPGFTAYPVEKQGFFYQTVEVNWNDLDGESDTLTGCRPNADFSYKIDPLYKDGTYTKDEPPQLDRTNETMVSQEACRQLYNYTIQASIDVSSVRTVNGSVSDPVQATMEGCPEPPQAFDGVRQAQTTIKLTWKCPESWGGDTRSHGDPAFRLEGPGLPADGRDISISAASCADAEPFEETVSPNPGEASGRLTYKISSKNSDGFWGPFEEETIPALPVPRILDATVISFDEDAGTFEIGLEWNCVEDINESRPGPEIVESEATHTWTVIRNGEAIDESDNCNTQSRQVQDQTIDEPGDEEYQYVDELDGQGATFEYQIQPERRVTGEKGNLSPTEQITTWFDPSAPDLDLQVFNGSHHYSVKVHWNATPFQRGGAANDTTEYEVRRDPPDRSLENETNPRECELEGNVEHCVDDDHLFEKNPDFAFEPCATYTYSVRQTDPVPAGDDATAKRNFTPWGPAGSYNGTLALVDTVPSDPGYVRPTTSELTDSDGDGIREWAEKAKVDISVNRSDYETGCNDPAEPEEYIVWRDTQADEPEVLDRVDDPSLNATEDLVTDDEVECGLDNAIRYKVQPTFSHLPEGFQTRASNASDWSEWFEVRCPSEPPTPPGVFARGGPALHEVQVCFEVPVNVQNPERIVVKANLSDATWTKTVGDEITDELETGDHGCIVDSRDILTNGKIQRPYEVYLEDAFGQRSEPGLTNAVYPAITEDNQAPTAVDAIAGNWYGEVHLNWTEPGKRDLAANQSFNNSSPTPVKAAPDPDRYDIFYKPFPAAEPVKIDDVSAKPYKTDGIRNYTHQICFQGLDTAVSIPTVNADYRPGCIVPNTPTPPGDRATFLVKPVWSHDGNERVGAGEGDQTDVPGTESLGHVWIRGDDANVHVSGTNVTAEPGTSPSTWTAHVHVNWTQNNRGPGVLGAEGYYVDIDFDEGSATVYHCEREGTGQRDVEDPKEGECPSITTVPTTGSSCTFPCGAVTAPLEGGDRLRVDFVSEEHAVISRVTGPVGTTGSSAEAVTPGG